MTYIFLFFSALGAATLLPISSEAVLLYDLSMGYLPFWLWLVATLGNTIGSLINYYIGLKGENYLETRGYLCGKKIQKYRVLFERYGGYLLFFSWMPVVGDPLTLIAGMLRYDIKYFVWIVAIAKGMRYALLVWLSWFYV